MAIVDARADAGKTRLPIEEEEEEEERVVSSNETPTVVVVDAAILQNKREKTSGRFPSGWCRRRCLLAAAENMLSFCFARLSSRRCDQVIVATKSSKECVDTKSNFFPQETAKKSRETALKKKVNEMKEVLLWIPAKDDDEKEATTNAARHYDERLESAEEMSVDDVVAHRLESCSILSTAEEDSSFASSTTTSATTTANACDIPFGVDFHEWQRAAMLAKMDARKGAEEKRRSEIKLSPPPHRVLHTLEEGDEKEEDVGTKEEEEEEKVESMVVGRRENVVEEKKRETLREELRKEKMKNRVMERNVKAEAVALARRILADEKRRKEAAHVKKKMTGETKKSATQLREEKDEKAKRNIASTRITFEHRYNKRTAEMKRRKESRRSTVNTDVAKNIENESNRNRKPEWNDSFATERFERFPDAPLRSPVTVEELRRREKEKRKEALHKPFSSVINARKSRSSTSSSSSLTSVVNSRRIFG